MVITATILVLGSMVLEMLVNLNQNYYVFVKKLL